MNGDDAGMHTVSEQYIAYGGRCATDLEPVLICGRPSDADDDHVGQHHKGSAADLGWRSYDEKVPQE